MKSDRYITKYKGRGEGGMRISYEVWDTFKDTSVFVGSQTECHTATDTYNSGAPDAFKEMKELLSALLIPQVREHPVPWSVTDSGFGADVVSNDGTVVASCQNGNDGMTICRMARELEHELNS